MWIHTFEFCTLTKVSITNKETFLKMKGQVKRAENNSVNDKREKRHM